MRWRRVRRHVNDPAVSHAPWLTEWVMTICNDHRKRLRSELLAPGRHIMKWTACRSATAVALAVVVWAAPSLAEQPAVKGRIKYYPSHELITMDMQTRGLFHTLDGKPGLRGEYFNNRKLDGEPVMVRVDPEIQDRKSVV